NTASGGGQSIEFNATLYIDTVTQTVPPGKTWKVESFIKHSNAFAAPPVVSSNSPQCQGQTLNLSVAGALGTTYSWTGPNNFSSSSQNPPIPNVQLAASVTYSVVANLNGWSSNPVTTNVTINPLPNPTFTLSPNPVIVNNPSVFTPTSSGLTYAWSFQN